MRRTAQLVFSFYLNFVLNYIMGYVTNYISKCLKNQKTQLQKEGKRNFMLDDHNISLLKKVGVMNAEVM